MLSTLLQNSPVYHDVCALHGSLGSMALSTAPHRLPSDACLVALQSGPQIAPENSFKCASLMISLSPTATVTPLRSTSLMAASKVSVWKRDC